MTLNQLMNRDFAEKPLDYLPDDGGFCSIFRTIACVGDSLSSGEFVANTENGEYTYHDMYDYSWGQYLARMAGCTVYNFSIGGMSASAYCEGFATQNNFWSPVKAAQAYYIALGVNDLFGQNQVLGTVEDISPDGPEHNAKTFAGYFARIIQQYKNIQPNAKFFLLTIPDWYVDDEPRKIALADGHADLMHEFAAYFSNTYVIDLRREVPPLQDNFKKRFMLSGHMTPTGYILMARLICAYTDYIIRHNMEEFRQVGMIGTPFVNTVDV